MIDYGVKSVEDFEWSKHPKHYCNCDSFYLQPVHEVRKDAWYYDSSQTEAGYKEYIDKVLADTAAIGSDLLVSYQ